MHCPNCGSENRAGAKFCNECATPLPVRCSACGAENRAGAKFCDECAAPLIRQPSVVLFRECSREVYATLGEEQKWKRGEV